VRSPASRRTSWWAAHQEVRREQYLAPAPINHARRGLGVDEQAIQRDPPSRRRATRTSTYSTRTGARSAPRPGIASRSRYGTTTPARDRAPRRSGPRTFNDGPSPNTNNTPTVAASGGGATGFQEEQHEAREQEQAGKDGRLDRVARVGQPHDAPLHEGRPREQEGGSRRLRRRSRPHRRRRSCCRRVISVSAPRDASVRSNWMRGTMKGRRTTIVTATAAAVDPTMRQSRRRRACDPTIRPYARPPKTTSTRCRDTRSVSRIARRIGGPGGRRDHVERVGDEEGCGERQKSGGSPSCTFQRDRRGGDEGHGRDGVHQALRRQAPRECAAPRGRSRSRLR